MPKKKFCRYCCFQKEDYEYSFVTKRGEYICENSFEGYIRKLSNYAELVIDLDGYHSESVGISFCPWCGRKLSD